MVRGDRLKKLRTDKKMTQKDLAILMHLNKSTICTYETEKRNPPYQVLEKYIEIFGVSSEYLLGIDKLSIKEDKEPYNYVTLTNEEIFFIKLLREEKIIYDILLNDPKRGMEIIKRKIG